MSLLITGVGPTVERTFTYPDADAKILTDRDLVTVAQGGTGLAALVAHALYVGNGASAPTALAIGATGQVLIGNTGADPSWSASPTLTSVTLGSSTVFGLDSANVPSLKNGTTAQQLNIYRTTADGTRLTLDAGASGIIGIYSNYTSGAGLPFGFGAGAIQWTVSRTVASALSPYGDNTNDIGDATYRVRTGYFGTALAVGTNPATSGDLRLQSGFTLQARNAANAANGTILTTDALDFTKLSSNRVSSTVNTAMSLGATAEGFLFIEAEGDQAGAIFYLRGGGNGTTLISQFGNIWSVTAGSNAHFNVYWSAGNSRYELENNNLSTQFMRFVLVGF